MFLSNEFFKISNIYRRLHTCIPSEKNNVNVYSKDTIINIFKIKKLVINIGIILGFLTQTSTIKCKTHLCSIICKD